VQRLDREHERAPHVTVDDEPVLVGVDIGMPEWLRSKCKPLGVIIPSSKCSGVRAVPTPGSGGLGGERMARTTLSWKREGWP
jgi:hypothetical protein